MSLTALEPGGQRDGAFWPEPYQSQAMPLVFDHLQTCPQGKSLDVGPVCSENINYQGQWIKTVYVCDLFLRLHRLSAKKEPPGRVLHHLDYPGRLFELILLWDLPDRLHDADLVALVERCREMGRPGARVFVCAQPERSAGNMVYSLVIGPNYRLYPRQQNHLRLDSRGRPNREILGVFDTHFKPLKSFIYRNGFREFLFQLR